MPKRNKAFRDEAGNNYVPIENKMYMGLHFANDASMGNNAEVDGNLLTFATEEIDIGDEVLFEHKWKTGWSNKKKKVRIVYFCGENRGESMSRFVRLAILQTKNRSNY